MCYNHHPACVYKEILPKTGRYGYKGFNCLWNVSGFAEKEENEQCATFLHVTGEEALDVCNTFDFAESEKDKIAETEIHYCEPTWHMFFTRVLKKQTIYFTFI